MLIRQQRITPRWKEWVPLATQEFRLRNLVQIIAMNVGNEDLSGQKYKRQCDINSSLPDQYYFTLHATAMSAPFYTSEKLDSDCPKWKEIESSTWSKVDVFSGTKAFVFRLWCSIPSSNNDEVITVWGVHLSGLVLLGSNLNIDATSLKPNTIIFLLPGGYYTHPEYIATLGNNRYLSANVAKEDARHSYSFEMLHRLHFLQRSILQKTNESNILKEKIASGNYIMSDNRRSATLRRILSKSKSKTNHLEVDRLKKALELEKFLVQVLREEKSELLHRIKVKRERLEALNDLNQLIQSRTMENYRLLHREVQAHREWLIRHIELRETHIHARAILHFRIKQLISEVSCIYPVEKQGDKFTICRVHLPDTESCPPYDELSIGLGFVAHAVQMISYFLQVPLRYPIVHFGSRSRIMDLVADKIPDSEREFPLFCRGQDKLQFNYAVYLLNKNIAQLRWCCWLSTPDLRCTLSNLASLLHIGVSDIQPEFPFQSPSSSTLDVASSFSVSSPVESNFSPRRMPCRTQRMSESLIVTIKKEAFVPTGHRITKSAGCAMDFHLTPVPMPSPPLSEDLLKVIPLTNNLSYSLDKGLDEYKEISRSEGPETIENTVPFNLGGSETSLACLSRKNSMKERICMADEASSTSFLQNWESEAKNAIVSDNDSDLNISGILVEKAISTVQDVVSVQICSANSINCTEDDRVSTSIEACDDASDPLMINVTNRTEALANNSSSFNMFRSRFRTNVGSNNQNL